MSIFSFIKNYKKAKEFDKLVKSVDSLYQFVSYSIVKKSTRKDFVIEYYEKDIFESKGCIGAFIYLRDLVDEYHRQKILIMELNRDKLKAEVELLKLKKCQQ